MVPDVKITIDGSSGSRAEGGRLRDRRGVTHVADRHPAGRVVLRYGRHQPFGCERERWARSSRRCRAPARRRRWSARPSPARPTRIVAWMATTEVTSLPANSRTASPRPTRSDRSAATAPSTARVEVGVAQRATAVDERRSVRGDARRHRGRGRRDRCASARTPGIPPRGKHARAAAPAVRRCIDATRASTPGRERGLRIRRGMLRSPVRGDASAVPRDAVGAGRAGRAAMARPRAPRRRPRPVVDRATTAGGRVGGRRRSLDARHLGGNRRVVAAADHARDDGAEGRARTAGRGAEPAGPDPARAGGRVHHPAGGHRGDDHDGALARVRPRRARARPRRRAGLLGDHHRSRHRPRDDRQHVAARPG